MSLTSFGFTKQKKQSTCNDDVGVQHEVEEIQPSLALSSNKNSQQNKKRRAEEGGQPSSTGKKSKSNKTKQSALSASDYYPLSDTKLKELRAKYAFGNYSWVQIEKDGWYCRLCKDAGNEGPFCTQPSQIDLDSKKSRLDTHARSTPHKWEVERKLNASRTSTNFNSTPQPFLSHLAI